MKKNLFYFSVAVISFYCTTCVDNNSSSDSAFGEEVCRLNINLKEEWSFAQNNPYVKFLVNADNTGDLPVNAIHVTVNLYFKNGNILKTRFYLNDLEILSGESIEEYGIIFDSNSERFFTDGLSQNDLDRIIYNAPYYSCIE
tara:strand:+ start:2518 stop:2943 length:426 start_codon:yes stop_codon:yes gene_type:complete